MEHPLIPNIDHMTMEELGTKISELNKKLSIASRTGNNYLCNQLRMALETYNNRYQLKLQELYKTGDGKKFDDKIDIS